MSLKMNLDASVEPLQEKSIESIERLNLVIVVRLAEWHRDIQIPL